MKADMALAAQDLASDGHNSGYLATVDATQERSLGALHEVRGFPTLLYFVDGKRGAEYDRRRSRDDLVQFMKDQHKLGSGERQKTEL